MYSNVLIQEKENIQVYFNSIIQSMLFFNEAI